jgi:hypothetical protein
LDLIEGMRSPSSFAVSVIAQTSKTLHFILILENECDRVLVLVSVRSPNRNNTNQKKVAIATSPSNQRKK